MGGIWRVIPKYRKLADTLRERIGLSTESVLKLPTERELAAIYKVSRQTVRQALGVLADEGLIDKKQGSGNYVYRESEKVKKIAVIAPSTDYCLTSSFREMQEVLVAGGCSVQMYSTENRVSREREILKNILKSPVDGICVKGTVSALPNPNLDQYRYLINQGVSVLFLDGGYRGLEDTVLSVAPDNLAGGYLAVRHLIQQNHTRIGCLFCSDDLQGVERFQGCVNAVRDYGLPIVDDCYFWYDSRRRDLMKRTGGMGWLKEAAGVLQELCTAVVCQDNEMAQRLSCILQVSGAAWEAFSVLCFDDGYYSGAGSMPVDVLSCRKSHPGRAAAETILKQTVKNKTNSIKLNWELERKKTPSGENFQL